VLIAFISDIHANLSALKAAVADAKASGADEIMCAGDLTGYGPFPNEVCNYLAKQKISTIRGNYDGKVLDVLKNGESIVADMDKKKRKFLLWTVQQISKTVQHYLEALPESLERELPGKKKLLVVHGSAISNDDNVYPSLTAAALKTKLGDSHPDILVCGHTHVPFLKIFGRTMVVNCGSVGQPVDGDPRPAYALVSVNESKVHGNIVRFAYDVQETVTALKNTSLPKALQKDYISGTKRRFLQ
jgi:putative phosphoesterase